MGAVTKNPVRTSTYDLKAGDNPITFGKKTNIDVTNGDAVYGGTAASWTVTNNGSLSASGVGQSGILLVGISGDAGTIVNNGQISATEGASTPSHDAGIRLDNYGKVTNAKTGKITVSGSYVAGIGIYDGGTVANSGTVSASGSNVSGVFFNAGGKLTNNAGGSITCQDDGVFAWNDAVQVTNAGSITGGDSGVYLSGSAGTVTNTGSITGQNSNGVRLAAGGSIDNKAGGTITATGSYLSVADLDGYGTITNDGGIYGSGMHLSGLAIKAGGKITNGGIISVAGQYISGVGIDNGGTLINTGSIYAEDSDLAGVVLNAGGTVTNSGSIDAKGTTTSGIHLDAGGTVTNYGSGTVYGETGVWESGAYNTGGAAASVTNAGTITGTGNAVYLEAGGTVVNSGKIIAGAASDGVLLLAPGTLTNNTGGTITSAKYGVSLHGAGSSVTNSGSISGTSDSVAFWGSGANTLTLETGSSLTGNVLGSSASGATNALVLDGSGSTNVDFSNFNTLGVVASANWTLSGYSTIGTSTIDGDLTVTGDLDTAFTIEAGGVFELVGGGASDETSAALANAGTLDIGNGSQAAPDIVEAASLTNSGTINLTGNGAEGAALTLTGTLTNKGVITVTNDAEELGGAVSGTGSFTLDGTSTLQFDSSAGADQTITLDGTDEIALQEAQDFHALIAGFGAGGALDSIDAMNFPHGSSTFSFSENAAHTMATLTLTDGAEVAHFRLSGDYMRSDFKVGPDAAGTGTLIKFV
jgi:hypothetical protein